MADSFKNSFPVLPVFSIGEQPTNSKLSLWALQTKAAITLLEQVIGDAWSNNHPLFPSSSNTPFGSWAYDVSGNLVGSSQRHAQILNLARLIGPASVLNPRILSELSDLGTVTITDEAVPQSSNNFYLRYAPVTNVVFSNAAKFATLKASRDLVRLEGDYHVNETTGEVLVGYSTTVMGTVTYDVTSTAQITDTYYGATYNVYPDPNQAVKCTVAGPVSGQYSVTLPTITNQQIALDESGSTIVETEPNYGQGLYLPTWVTDEFPVAGDVITDGLVGLWDEDTKSFVSGLTFYSNASRTVIKCSGATLEASTDRYSLVLIGTSITLLLDELRERMSKHVHDGTNGDQRIDHNDLAHRIQGSKTIVNGDNDRYVFLDDDTFPTQHPQYLGRWGTDTSFLKNAMLGTLLLSSTGATGGAAPFNLSYDSEKIQFGSESGPYIRYDNSDDALAVSNKPLLSNEELYIRRGVSGGDLLAVGGLAKLTRYVGVESILDGVTEEVFSQDFLVSPFAVDSTVKMKVHGHALFPGASGPTLTVDLILKATTDAGTITLSSLQAATTTAFGAGTDRLRFAIDVIYHPNTDLWDSWIECVLFDSSPYPTTALPGLLEFKVGCGASEGSADELDTMTRLFIEATPTMENVQVSVHDLSIEFISNP